MMSIRNMTMTLCVATALSLAFLACGSNAPTTTPGGTSATSAGAAKQVPAIFHALPANTVVAVALTDLDGLANNIKQTALYEAWQDPSLKTWREQSLPKFKAAFAQKIGLAPEDLDSLAHGDVLATISMSPAQPNQPRPQPRVAIVVRATPNNKPQLEAAVQKMIAKAQGPNKPVTRWAGDVLIIAQDDASAAEVEANVKAGRSPIETTKGYAAFLSCYDPQGFAHFWFNAEKALSLALSEQPPQEREKTQKIFAASGLSNLSAFYASSAIQKKGFGFRGFVKLDGGRQGLFTMFGDNGPSKAARIAPPDSVQFFSLRHAGLDRLVSLIRSTALASGEVTSQTWQQQMMGFSMMLGVNVETDLPKLLGKEIAVSVSGTTQPSIIPPLNIYIESPDVANLVMLIERLIAPLGVKPGVSEQQGVRYKYVTIPNFPFLYIAYGQIGDFLVISFPTGMYLASANVLTSKKSLADAPAFTQAMADAGQPGWMDSYSKATGGPTAGQDAGRALVDLFNQFFNANLTPADAPNLQALIAKGGPMVSRLRTTADAVEIQGFSSIGLDPESLVAIRTAASMVGGGMVPGVPGMSPGRPSGMPPMRPSGARPGAGSVPRPGAGPTPGMGPGAPARPMPTQPAR